ncbi:MAG TPA: hypothetical protein VJG90_05660, partial [Candidatus Nanoarchaeia archaeon]|nr:hypothetical protein [Candidatus Nanoarchaeia archaeon]
GSDRDLTLSFLKGRPYGEYWLEAAKLHDKGDHLQSWRAFTELPQPVIISIGHIPIEYRHERTTIRSIVSVTHAEQHARIPEEEAKGDITVPMYFVMPISLESMASTLPQLPGGISESLEGPVRGLLEMRREYMRCGRATYTATGDYAYSLESLRKEYQPKVRGEFHPRLKEVLASSG